MAPVTNESLLKAARNANIKLPKSKKECLEEVESALAAAMADDSADDDYEPNDKKRALKILKGKFGRTAETKPDPKKEKPSGKRKAETAVAADKKVSKKPVTSSSSSVLDEVWDVSDKPKRNACGTKLIDVANTRGVKMPEDERAARMGAFTAVMGVKDETGKVIVRDAIEFLEDKFGKDPNWVDPDSKAPKKKKVSKAKPCTSPENSDLAEAFDELAGLYFKEQSKAGFVYKKVVSAIKDLPEPLRAAPKKGEIKGVGAKTIAKIKEFLETGKIQELEDKRADSLA